MGALHAVGHFASVFAGTHALYPIRDQTASLLLMLRIKGRKHRREGRYADSSSGGGHSVRDESTSGEARGRPGLSCAEEPAFEFSALRKAPGAFGGTLVVLHRFSPSSQLADTTRPRRRALTPRYSLNCWQPRPLDGTVQRRSLRTLVVTVDMPPSSQLVRPSEDAA
jgi:hypothetical protein